MCVRAPGCGVLSQPSPVQFLGDRCHLTTLDFPLVLRYLCVVRPKYEMTAGGLRGGVATSYRAVLTAVQARVQRGGVSDVSTRPHGSSSLLFLQMSFKHETFTFHYFVGFRIVAKGWSPSQVTRKGYEGRDVDRQQVMTRGRSATEKSSCGSLGVVGNAVCGTRQRGWGGTVGGGGALLKDSACLWGVGWLRRERRDGVPVRCSLLRVGRSRRLGGACSGGSERSPH